MRRVRESGDLREAVRDGAREWTEYRRGRKVVGSETSDGKLVGEGLEGKPIGVETVIGEVEGGGKGARVFDRDKSGGKEAEGEVGRRNGNEAVGEGDGAAVGRRRRVVFGFNVPHVKKHHGAPSLGSRVPIRNKGRARISIGRR